MRKDCFAFPSSGVSVRPLTAKQRGNDRATYVLCDRLPNTTKVRIILGTSPRCEAWAHYFSVRRTSPLFSSSNVSGLTPFLSSPPLCLRPRLFPRPFIHSLYHTIHACIPHHHVASCRGKRRHLPSSDASDDANAFRLGVVAVLPRQCPVHQANDTTAISS